MVRLHQAVIHFKTYTTSDPKDTDPDPDNLVDDTCTMGIGPFELLIGREFKLPLWEDMIKTMKVGEISRFGCEFRVCSLYHACSVLILHIHPYVHFLDVMYVCTLYQYCDDYGVCMCFYVCDVCA